MSGERVTLEDLKRRAVELRLRGVRPLEISEELGSGHSPWVIRHWLRKAGVKNLIRRRVLDLSSEKQPLEIANDLGLSERRIRKIVQDERGPARVRRSTRKIVDLFLSDPNTYVKAKFTQTEPFGRALLKRCVEAVDESPVGGLRNVLLPSIGLLDRIRRTRQIESTWRAAYCLYLQSRAIEAHVYTVTKRCEIALKLLVAALDLSKCISCEADELRRLGTLHGSMGRWDDAYLALDGAFERYRWLGRDGHDLYGNGMANCFLLKCKLHYFVVSPYAAAMEARNGLKIMTGRESPFLFVSLILALAKCLQSSKNPKEIQESEELLDWCFDHFKMSKNRTVARPILYWLKGNLLVTRNCLDDARHFLTLALEDAQELELRDVGDILADLGTLNPDPILIRNYIEDFCDWDKKGNMIVPSWCKDLESEILPVYNLVMGRNSPIDVSIFSALREAAGRERRMPPFFMPPPSTSEGFQTWDALR